MTNISMKSSLIAELEREAAVARKTLERVPADKFDWKPHEKSMPMGRLATHIATLPHFMALVVEKNSVEAGGGEGRTPEKPQTAAELTAVLDKYIAEAKKALAGTSDDDLVKGWTMTFQGKEIMKMPRHAAIQIIGLNHFVHHRAQLGVYLRMNDVPVPSSYGPSADEQM